MVKFIAHEEVHRTSSSHTEVRHESEAEHELESEHESDSELESESESIFKDDTTDIILAVIGEEDEPQTS